jgi:hypothetical protein
VVNQKRRHLYILIGVDQTGFNLSSLNSVSGLVGGFQPIEADANVFAVSFQNVIGHRSQTLRAVYLERLFAFQHPGRKDEIGVTGSVVGMEMSYERSG